MTSDEVGTIVVALLAACFVLALVMAAVWAGTIWARERAVEREARDAHRARMAHLISDAQRHRAKLREQETRRIRR